MAGNFLAPHTRSQRTPGGLVLDDDPATPVHEQSLLWTLEEIGRLVSASGHPAETLDNIVKLIQRRFTTDVCSVYLLDGDRTTLVLAATMGLRPDSVRRVRMRVSEGLAGLVAERMAPVRVADALLHPRFKYFREADEDPYRTFLGVPILDRAVLQGVLVVQTKDAHHFTDDEVRMLAVAGAQLAPIVGEARVSEQVVVAAHHRLGELANNLWWSWDEECVSLFRELHPAGWRQLDHNPVALLQTLDMRTLDARATELALHGRVNHAYRRLQEYLACTHTWADRHASVLHARTVAYFSAEFGLHESIPIYSGGLGVLAGDHLKSASDLGVPLVGVGLYYGQGYFRQRLDGDGWQHEDYVDVDRDQLPLRPAIVNGSPLVVEIATRTGTIAACVRQLAVGRNLLYLLDSDIDGNHQEDRRLTSRLYGGDERVRIRQELLLGVGGVKALAALGITPGVVHLNEGHSAFAALELARQRMALEGVDAGEALRRVAAHVVFTTHTPVPAGHDRFSPALVEEHLGPMRDALGMNAHDLMALGRVNPLDLLEPFCMTVLALKLSHRANAVSSLHGHVSRAMWTSLFPTQRVEHVPIGHITNGVHVKSWLAPQMKRLYDRYLGSDWAHTGGESAGWDAVENIDDGELWETHQTLKAQLVTFARSRAVQQAERRGGASSTVAAIARALSPDALTIGFARRFATYKRANLVLQDLEAVADLVNNATMPVQFIFAGKAHPQDLPGKAMLQQVARLMDDSRFAGKILFIEDYDLNVGRYLVHGVDVWLNNPRRPLEACGTSGQKVVLNGGLNLSVLDGWWAEAYDGLNGFAIGNGEVHSSTAIHDARDGASLRTVLADTVVPLYYKRDIDGLPRAWIRRMKRAIRTLGWRFSADRMVMDYVLRTYIAAAGGTSSSDFN